MPPSTLAAVAVDQVSQKLDMYGSSLRGPHRAAIEALLETLEAGLTGELEPAYYLSALDPGIGKTLSVATFLKAWKAQGFKPASSVLIGLSRLEEIGAYLEKAGLNREDFSVLTSKPEWNERGVPADLHGSAPIMFTTQQMIERRTRGLTFAEASEFHFEGKPRRLRIWDESFVPAVPLVVSADHLGRLPFALRSQSPDYAAEVQKLLATLLSSDGTGCVVVPKVLADAPRYGRGANDNQVADTIEALASLAGQTVTIVEAGAGELRIAGASQPLPSDFAPVVILDASGRVRSTYRLWKEAGGNLKRLPSAAKDYSNLRVHVWERQVGRTALHTPGAIEDVGKALAEVLAGDEATDWLIVCYKAHSSDLQKALKAPLGKRLHFLTWGMHHGTNTFEHCQRVVLIGQLTYGTSGYRALAAACGSSADGEVGPELKAGEYRHNILQALTRASVRRSSAGLAGTCHAYVVASRNVGAYDLLPEVFPGCTIERWAPDVPEVGRRAGQLIELLEDARDRKVGQIAKKELREALSMKPPHFTRLLKDPKMVLWLEERHIRVERTVIVIPRGFDPYPGEGFTIDQLDDLD